MEISSHSHASNDLIEIKDSDHNKHVQGRAIPHLNPDSPTSVSLFPFVDLSRASQLDRITVIKAEISAREVKKLSMALHFDQQVVLDALRLKAATVNGTAARDERLSIEDGERVVGLATLVGRLEAMLEDVANSEGFDARSSTSEWLRDPLPGLGGSKPIDL